MLSALPKGKRVGQRNDRTTDKVLPAYIMRLAFRLYFGLASAIHGHPRTRHQDLDIAVGLSLD